MLLDKLAADIEHDDRTGTGKVLKNILLSVMGKAQLNEIEEKRYYV